MATNLELALSADNKFRPGQLVRSGLVLGCGAFFLVCMAAASGGASAAGRDSTTWQEEALQHDGSKIVVQRTAQRGGRREPGQDPPIREQSLAFKLPGTQRTILWQDHYAQDIGAASFNVKLMEVVNGTPYVLASPAGCLAYNKWGRPNPPYVIFKFDGVDWQRIPLEELPAVVTKPNLNGSSPVRQQGKSYLSAEDVAQLNAGYRQLEFRSILRAPLTKEYIADLCEERVLYKGFWVLPNDPVARKIIDQRTQ